MHHHTIKFQSHIYTPSIILSPSPPLPLLKTLCGRGGVTGIYSLRLCVDIWEVSGGCLLRCWLFVTMCVLCCFIVFVCDIVCYFHFFQFVLYFNSNTVLKHTVYNCCLTVTISFKSFTHSFSTFSNLLDYTCIPLTHT
jgi:hypothetical protein